MLWSLKVQCFEASAYTDPVRNITAFAMKHGDPPGIDWAGCSDLVRLRVVFVL